jgi:folate-binding protein YgfZ
MQRSLHDSLLQSGAVINGERALPLHFGEPEAELRTALHRAVLVERSTLGRVLSRGRDLLDLLHRLSTHAVAGLETGEGRPTVLTTPKGRIVARLFVHHLGDGGVLLVGGPGSAPRVIEHLDQYTFSEETALSDVTAETCQLALVGPMAADALAAAGFPRPEPFHASRASFEGTPVDVLGQDGLSGNGFSIVLPTSLGGALWRALFLAVTRIDGRPAGEEAMEAYRILNGIPGPDTELNEDHNPLEAGLWDSVSFDKGCYVGQEVVARLNTYDKVSRALMGLELPENATAPGAGTPLYRDGREVGRISSGTLPPGHVRPVALAYVTRRAVEPGIELCIGTPTADLRGTLIEPPFPPRLRKE